MPRLQRRSFAEPEETRRFPHGTVRTVALDEVVFGEYRFEPGWKWSTVIKPIAGTPLCQHRHIGYALGGQLHVSMADGTTMDFFAGDAYEIPPGHDAWVVGDQTWVAVEFSGARTFGIAPGEFGAGSIVATLVFTDIVGSTAMLARVGDAAWREMLLEHNAAVRFELGSGTGVIRFGRRGNGGLSSAGQPRDDRGEWQGATVQEDLAIPGPSRRGGGRSRFC